jgi:serine protease
MSPYNFAGRPVLALELARIQGFRRAAHQMRRPLPIFATATLLVALGAGAGAASASTGISPAREFAPGQVVVKFDGEPSGQTIALPHGAGVRRTAAALRRNPRVAYAEPNYVASASAVSQALDFVFPNDPGTLEAAEAATTAGDWSFKQWNFLSQEEGAVPSLPTSPGGIDAVGAWQNLEEAGRPGGEGVTVAVLDTGIAYRSKGRKFLRSPDFSSGQFVKGYDFIGRDRLPLDENGHGTHVAGTIAEKTGNGVGLTGLAYRAKLMPVRVLSRHGVGHATTIAKGIRFAVAHHAQVINMSFNFECGSRVPVVDEALREAYARGVVAVASGGNLVPPTPGQQRSRSCVSQPATGPRVIAVGGTTEGGCLGDYSLASAAIDVVAPGGGEPASGCPSLLARPIYQVTLKPRSTDEFRIPGFYIGTSMAAAHVSGVAAMVIAANTYGGPRFSPETEAGAKSRVKAVAKQLRTTARDLGLPVAQQGAGLIDAARATEPRGPQPPSP